MMRRCRFVAAGCTLLLAPVVLSMVGCRTDRYEFNPQTFKFERTYVEAYPIAGSGEAGEAVEFYPAAPSKAVGAAPLPPETQPVAVQQAAATDFLQLSLATADAARPDASVVLQRAPADKCAHLLQILYPGAGPGGTGTWAFILYSDSRIGQKARDMAHLLDEPAVEPAEAPDAGKLSPQPAWRVAIGLIYASQFPRRVSASLRDRVRSRLDAVIDAETTAMRQRWAAALIAARLMLFEPKDTSAAAAYLQRGKSFSEADSYEAMVVRYHHLRLWKFTQPRDAFRGRLQQALRQFTRYNQSECYRLIEALSEQKR